jgi:hypothetical protein
VETLRTLQPHPADVTVANASGRSLLQDSVDRALYAANAALYTVTGTPGDLFDLLGLELDMAEILDGLLLPLGLDGLDGSILARLCVGAVTDFTSLSGYGAKYLSLRTNEDRADLLTAILRLVLDLVQGNTANRERVVTLITDLIAPSGFAGTAVHWGIHYTLWSMRIFGTEINLCELLFTMRAISFFMPLLNFFKMIFGGLFGWK